MFYNNILPTSIGGDVARIYLLYRKCQEIYKASSIVVFERLVGVAATASISLVAALFVFHLKGIRIFLYYYISCWDWSGVFYII